MVTKTNKKTDLNLVLVESPAKAKIIAKYLNENANLMKFGTFHVMASMGHVRDLPHGTLGINIDNEFTPTYQVSPDKQKVVDEMKAYARKSKSVWLASDFDREGEGIAAHLRDVLQLRNHYKRITFTEITPRALEAAVLNPRDLDMHLVDAQETRRILDRLVGFKITPLLWKHYNAGGMGNLSAGRVQSAVLNIIVSRESEIKAFEHLPYWHVQGEFRLNTKTNTHDLNIAKLYEKNVIYKEEERHQAKTLLSKLAKKHTDFYISDVKTRFTRTSPDHPFITSTLQQEASSKLGFTLKRTMMLAQELYERGHITYMRTDSYTMSDDFKKATQSFIAHKYGSHYLTDKEIRTNGKKHAQEAHEAIRPTCVEALSVSSLGDDHNKLYELIWKRSVASLMTQCIKEHLDVTIMHPSIERRDEPMYFMSSLVKIKFNGYMCVYGVESEKYDLVSYVQDIESKQCNVVCNALSCKQVWKAAPQRYTESSIIHALEKDGIGRPSTYASILGKLFDKQYVIKQDVKGIVMSTVDYEFRDGVVSEKHGELVWGEERSKLVPTTAGIEINAFVSKWFPYITDKMFTSTMEEDLDRIANGDTEKQRVLDTFWKKFSDDIASTTQSLAGTPKQQLIKESYDFTVDGEKYIVRYARYGPVIEYRVSSEKKFIGLKPYMKMFKKDLLDINESDIRLLKSLPKQIAIVYSEPMLFVYGPYGFYAKHNDKNVKLHWSTVSSILKNNVRIEDLEKAVDAFKEKTACKSDVIDIAAAKSSSSIRGRRRVRK